MDVYSRCLQSESGSNRGCLQLNTPLELLDAIGYAGSANLVGLFWSRCGDELVVVDERRMDCGLHNHEPWLELMRRLPQIPEVCFGDSDREPTHWMVIHRASNTFAIVPSPIARNFVTGEPIPLPRTEFGADVGENPT